MMISKRSYLNASEREKYLSPLIDQICNSDPVKLPSVLAAHSKWNLPQGSLVQWVRVLNFFDDILEKQVAKYDLAAEHPKLREIAPEDAALVIAVLKFTKTLLDHCTGRSIYASADRVFALVNTPSIDVKLASLEVALCLGERYVYGSQHKKFIAPKPVRLRLLEMAKSFPPGMPASFIQSRQEQGEKAAKNGDKPQKDHYSWVDALDHKQKYPSKWKSLNFEYYRSKPATEKKKEKKSKSKEKKKTIEEGLATFHLSDEHVRKLSLEQILDRAAEILPDYTWFTFSFFALNAKAFNTKSHDSMQLRTKLLRVKCLSIACVSCFCSSDFTACQLFELEPYTLGFLMELVMPENEKYVSSDLFYTASKTIRAISMKRVWGSEIVRHLGGNVNHGLLYEVLRHINKQIRSDKENPYEEGHKVFLTILGDLVESKTLAPRLVAGGLLTELMAFMDVRSKNRWTGSAAVHIIKILLGSSPEFVSDFADNDGFSLLISTINYEVDFALDNPGFAGGAPTSVPVHHTISLKQVKYLRNFLEFVSTLISTDAGDRLRNLFDSPILVSFNKIVMNPHVFGPTILAITLDGVAQIIHNEPTAFSILKEAGLVAAILDNYKNLFMPLGDLLLSLLEVLGAISLNKEGMNKVIESGVLHTFFLSFYDLELAKESMRSDMCTNIGCSMDELGRHNPPLRPVIMEEIKELIKNFADHANNKLSSITFYASPLGNMYEMPTEDVISKEDGQEEIESWDGIFASNLIDNVSGFLNGLLQDTGQWGKDVVENIGYPYWSSFFTMPNTPFDFTVSNGVLNLVAVLKYLDDEHPCFGLAHILATLSHLLDSPRIQSFLDNDERKSYFLNFESNPDEATMLLKELNIVNNLIFVLTEIFLNPSSISNDTYVVLFEFLEHNVNLLDKLVNVLQTAIFEETNIRSALPDDVMEKTSPSIFYTIKTTAIRILPRTPPTDVKTDEPTSAKYKNTLQLRFLMDSLSNNICVVLASISRSCMHRRQDIFDDKWRSVSVRATRQLAICMNRVLSERRELFPEKYLEYVLRVVHAISFVSTYKDRGKEALSTAFVSFFFHTTDLASRFIGNTISAFEHLCLLPPEELSKARDLKFIQNSTASIGFNVLSLSLSFISKLISNTHLSKFPMMWYYYNKEYCDNETYPVNGVISQSAVEVLKLLTQVVGSESIFRRRNDYSLIASFPPNVFELLVNIVRVIWSIEPLDEFYPLKEDWMTPALPEIQHLMRLYGCEMKEARELIAFGKSIKNVNMIAEQADKMDLLASGDYKERLENVDLEQFKYEGISTGAVSTIEITREREENWIYSIALVKITAFSNGLDRLVAFAFQKKGVDSKLVNVVFEAIEQVPQDDAPSRSKQLTNLISLLEELICRDPFITDSKLHEDTQVLVNKFVRKFLSDVINDPTVVETDYFAAGLSFLLPIFSQTPPTVFEDHRRYFPSLTESNALKDEIASAILQLQPTQNVKSATLLGRYMYLLSKDETYKQRVIKSPLLGCVIKNMRTFLESADKENHKVLQDSVILVIRTCFESEGILRSLFSAEIVKIMKKHTGLRRELGQMIHEARPLIGRDPNLFLKVASSMVRLENFDTLSSTSEKIYLVNEKTPEFQRQTSVDVEMKDPTDAEDFINPSGLVYTLLSQLMSIAKEDWYSSPENAVKENESKSPEKKKDESEFDFLMENKKFAYMCFLLQSICELVGSYSSAKLEFITFTKKVKTEENNKPRLISLNFFIHQLIPSQSLVSSSGPEFHRREAISSLAKLTLLALVSTTVQENDAVPDPRKEDADMAIVRKLMVDIISKILKETILETTNITRVYSKIYDIFDLCSCLLSTKFRELCYPLLSTSATKSDQFYIASAFIDSHLANSITSVISKLDLNFPDVSKVSNIGLKTLTSLAKTKLANADLFETTSAGDKDDDDIDEDEERDETPDLFRNSTLGMYDLDLESDEEDEFYQDQSLVPMSGSDISDDESDDSDEMGYSDMDSDIEEGELVEDEVEREGVYEGFDSDDSENNISFIEDLDIHSADGSEFDNSDASEFNGFDSEVELSEGEGEGEEEDDDDEFYDDEEIEYTEAELDGWEEAFADLPGSGESNERVRFGEAIGDEDEEGTRFEFDSDGNSDSELDDDVDPHSIGHPVRPTRESITSFFNALRPMNSPILSLNPSGILAGTIQIGTTRANDAAFPQLDAAFQALLNHDHSKSSVDHMLIRSSVERWAGAFAFYFRRFEAAFSEATRLRLKGMITAESYEIFKKKAEEKEKLRKKRQELLNKKREEALRKREEEAREREASQGSDAQPPREPVMLWIGNREVDISGTDIDPEFFEALPEDMREEVFTQHIRERRANANSTGGEVREIDPDFLEALPEQIRNEILQQESMTRRFSSDAFGLFQDDDELDSEMEGELDIDIDDEMDATNGDANDDNPATEETHSSEVSKKKKKSFSVPLIDRAGVASLVKLLFLPKPINQREHIYQTLVSICNNKSTRADVVSMLIAILHDGLVSQKALEKMFYQVSSKAAKCEQNTPSSFPIGCTPLSIGVQVIEALLYLLEKTPALRLYLLTEHENNFLTKKHLKKFRLKKASHCEERYPINLLFRLLENPLLSEEHLFIDLLSNVLNYATRSLLIMRDKRKPTPASFATNFIPDRNLRLIIKILASNECVNSTFRSTISCMHHLSLLSNAQNVFSTELSERASELGDHIIKDLKVLAGDLTKEQTDAHDNKVVNKFTASSSDQAKLLRILTALDYMYESQKRDQESKNTKDENDKLTGLYKHLQLGTLWKALSDCLRILDENLELSHIATALLPLIEALMVVCKHSKVKEIPIKDVMKYEVKKIDFTKEPIESLFFSFTDEHKKILNQMVRSNPNLMSGPFSMLVRNSRVLEFDNKRNYFNRQLHSGKEPSMKMSISIRRDQVFLDSYRALFFKSVEDFKKAHLEINFKGEAGIDAGGVTREWYQVLSRQMFNPDYALFTPVASDENTYHPNRTSYINPEHLSFFKFIGRTIGKAIFDECFLDCHFSRAVYKKILDRSVSLKDMETLDLEYFKSLMWMLENDITDIITEDFSVETDDYGEHKVIDLVPDGRNIPVTEENKQDYVRLVVEYRLQTSVSEQMKNFITGFHEIIPRDLVAIFDEQELELLISGLPDIDVQDWQNNTSYNNYSASSEQIQWFWRAVKSFDNEERAKLLQFSTGTSKVPLNGFKDLRGANGVCKFSIHRDYGAKDRLPSSHTCFNQIDLPVYDSYETLRGSLLLALSEGHEGFQLA